MQNRYSTASVTLDRRGRQTPAGAGRRGDRGLRGATPADAQPQRRPGVGGRARDGLGARRDGRRRPTGGGGGYLYGLLWRCGQGRGWPGGLGRLASPAAAGVAHLARRTAPGAPAVKAGGGHWPAAAGAPGAHRAALRPLAGPGLDPGHGQHVSPGTESPGCLRILAQACRPPLALGLGEPALRTAADRARRAIRPPLAAAMIFPGARQAPDAQRRAIGLGQGHAGQANPERDLLTSSNW